MNPFTFVFETLPFYLRAPDPSRDAHYREERDWVSSYRAPDEIDGRLVLDHARARYAEVMADFDELTARGFDLLKTAALVAALLITGIGAFGLDPTWPVRIALTCFVLSMVCSVCSRRPLECPRMPAVRHVLEGTPLVENPQAWLAASFHAANEGLRVVNNWKAGWLSAASLFLLLAMCWLLPVAFTAPTF